MNWRNTREYRVWRAHVIRRDKECVVCGSKKKRHAHHIHGSAHFEELRFDEDNGVCLCSVCHMNFHCNFKRSYREKCDMDDMCNFLDLLENMMDHFASMERAYILTVSRELSALIKKTDSIDDLDEDDIIIIDTV